MVPNTIWDKKYHNGPLRGIEETAVLFNAKVTISYSLISQKMRKIS
jgi:hypothetical protein